MERQPAASSGPTLSIAVAASIVQNAQSKELKTYRVSQIAKAAAVFKVDEIVVIDDKAKYQSR